MSTKWGFAAIVGVIFVLAVIAASLLLRATFG